MSHLTSPAQISNDTLILTPVVEEDLPQLYALSHATSDGAALYKLLPYGPFSNLPTYLQWAQGAYIDDRTCSAFVIRDKKTNKPLGLVAYLNVVPEHHRLEIGHIWVGKGTRKGVGSAAAYLLVSYAFAMTEWPCDRVEWKCHHENVASQATAKKVGFTFEGVFRNHMILKGERRHTHWFSITREDWPAVKERGDALFGAME
ncbi:hypothetical protein HKX48_004830 [Thoreauomyces humboldtii]|nr:hypothetical protein HKX48_004830 [Thoreauomyces humboldtii]